MVGAMPVNLIPKFCNETMDSHRIENCEIQVEIGSRVKCNEEFGTVKYIGEVQGHKGVWFGIEWDNPARGKHDGFVDCVQYFKTNKQGAGSFIRPNKVATFRTCAEAIRQYYGDREDETTAAHRRAVINEWKREMGAPFIEMVGFEKIHQKQKLDRLLEVSVHDKNVAKAGHLTDLCPNLRSLDVSRNLFSNWREVLHIGVQLKELRELDVSKNPMTIDIPDPAPTQLSNHFNKLEKLNISASNYTGEDLLKITQLFPNLKELIAAYNNIQIFVPVNVVNGLTTLWLDGNPITSWGDVSCLRFLKNLNVLGLNDCGIEEIRFGCAHNEKTDVFENLTTLFLNRNKINDWQSLSELNKLKSLQKLYFLRNPVLDSEDYDTASQMIIAKIGTLTELNGSLIINELRRGAEYDYLKRFGAEWKLAQNSSVDRKIFQKMHCRFDYLVEKYGIPDDSLLVKQNKTTTLQQTLIEITLHSVENNKTLIKKFPPTMQLQKLITLASRLFKGGNRKTYLHLYDGSRQTEILLDNPMKDLDYYNIQNKDIVLVKFD